MTNTALLIIDVQEAFNQRVALGHKRNNPNAEANIARLLAKFRQHALPVFHIRHASTDPTSFFAPEKTGLAPQEFVRAQAGEQVITKTANSSFIGTSLEADLRAQGLLKLIITGATSNHCVETTTRMAGNLGFDTHLVRDAIWTFDQIGVDGEVHLATDIHQMTLANLSGEFATVTDTETILALIK